MKKCVLSILVAIIMIISMMPTAFGATTKVALTVEASSATANVNDELTFTLYIQTFEDGTVSGFDLPINVPAGLTYVPNSGKVSDTFKETCKAENFEWIESGAKFFCASSELDGLANLNAKQAIGTFKCKVDNDASGSYNVGVSITAIEDKDVVNISNADYLVNTLATVNIAAAPTTYTVTITPGANMTPATTITNTVTVGNGTDVSFTAADGYYFPNDYTVAAQNGVRVVRVNDTKISVTGTPTGDVNITLPDATAKPAPTTYSVKINLGTGISISSSVTGNSTQTVTIGDPITPVEFVASEDYYFPTDYGYTEGDFTIAREGYTKIKVSGIPTGNVEFTLKDASKKATGPAAPDVGHTDCTTTENNDGTITGVNNEMEYRKGSESLWSPVTGGDGVIKGLVPGTYEVRYAATTTVKAGTSKTVVIKGYDPTVEKVTVTYNANDGTDASHSVQVDKGSNHVILGADACGFTAPQGMRLVYWSTTADNATGSAHYDVGDVHQNLQRDLTLYAVWDTTARTVQFDANGGTGTMQTVNVNLNDSYTLPPCTFTAPEGKEFDCWKIQGDNTNTSYNPRDSYTIKGNVKFVAQWKDKQGGGEQPTTFTLTFQPGEGSGDNYVVTGIDTPQYTLPDVPDTFTAPAGKPIFAGWKAEGGNVVYPAGTVIPVTADATFVAQWRADGPQGDTVLVTFKPGDGTGDAFELRVPAGDSYRLPAKPAGFKAPAGKVFAGWKIVDPQGNLNEKLYKAGHKFDLTEDVTFVAQWKTRPYYGDDTTPDTDPMVNPGTGAAPVGAPIAVVIAVAVAGAAYFVTTKKR